MKEERAKSFTLIELLVAISIFAIIAVVLYSSFRAGTLSWRRINSELDLQRKMKYAFHTIDNDLKNSVMLANVPFEGSQDKIKFISFRRLRGEKSGELCGVSYYLSSSAGGESAGTMIRAEEGIVDVLHSLSAVEEEPEPEEDSESKTPKKTGQERELLADVSGLKFSFLLAEDTGGEMEYEWVDAWDKDEIMPLGIKVEVEMKLPKGSEEIKLSRRIYIPAGSFKREEEAPGGEEAQGGGAGE